MDTSILQAALDYAARGWRVVPLDRSTKHPPLKDWQKLATTETSQIVLWFGNNGHTPDLGVALGKSSGIIDVETDSADGERQLVGLCGGEPPITARFRSGSGRGHHYLFRYRDDLPSKAHILHKGGLDIDFKLGWEDSGSQSVFPPSGHKSGGHYEWIAHPDDVGIADLPERLFVAIWNLDGSTPESGDRTRRPAEHWADVFIGSAEGGRNESMTSLIGKYLREAHDVADKEELRFWWQTVQAVNANNRPPLDEEELRSIFASIAAKEKLRREAEENALACGDEEAAAKHRAEAATKERSAGVYQITIIESDPVHYELAAPFFTGKVVGDSIRLTGAQLLSGRSVRQQALEQAGVCLPKVLEKRWDGMLQAALEAAERKAAPPEEKRGVVIAELVMDKLSKAREATDPKSPDPKGRPTKLPDGSMVFGFTRLWEDLRFGGDAVTRIELSRLLKQRLDYRRERFGQHFLYRITPDGMRELARIVADE